MALPTGPIDLPVFDDIIETQWGISVAQSLNNLKQAYEQILWNPTSDILAPTTYVSTGANDVWFQVGASTTTITVPEWATRAIVRVDLNGIWVDGSGDAVYDVQVQIGGASGVTGRRIRAYGRQTTALPADAGDRQFFAISWVDYLNITSLHPGDFKVRILAGRYDTVRTDQRFVVSNYTDVGVFIIYDGNAIGAYP